MKIRPDISRTLRHLTYIACLFIAAVMLFSGRFALKSEAASYSYEGQEFFDPLDSRPLVSLGTNMVGAMADESYFYEGRSKEQLISEYEAVAETIMAGINPEWSDLRKLIYLHDYICDNTDYAFETESKIKQTAYGCLVLHSCVCDGYSRAFYDLANRAGIETYYILSMQMNHAWNITKLDGRFYYADLTWDGSYEETLHKNFLKSESFFLENGHDCSDYCIAGYVNGNGDIYVNGLYNNTDLDDALWNDCKTALDMIGNSDEFFFYSDINGKAHFGTADRCKYTHDFAITYENNTWEGGQGIYDYEIRNGCLFIDRNCMWIYYGTPDYANNRLDFKLLKEAGSNEYIRKFYIDEGKLYYDSILRTQWSDNLPYEYDNVIDISGILYKEYYSNGIPDKSGSPFFLEGKDLYWNYSEGKYYWYENSRKQGTYDDAAGVMGDGSIRGREIFDPASNGWFWLDSVYDGAKAINKEVWIPYIFQGEGNFDEDEIYNLASGSDGGMEGVGKNVYEAIKNGSGKWVRYDSAGKMCKGWVTISGSMALYYPDQVGNTYYYDTITGLMAKGWVNIDGTYYHFDEDSGVLD